MSVGLQKSNQDDHERTRLHQCAGESVGTRSPEGLHRSRRAHLRDALEPGLRHARGLGAEEARSQGARRVRSEEHTSELQSQSNIVCRLLLEKKNKHPVKIIFSSVLYST